MDFPGKKLTRAAALWVAIAAVAAAALNGRLFYASDLSLILLVSTLATFGIGAAIAVSGARRIGVGSYLGGAFLTIGAGMLAMAIGFVLHAYHEFVALVPVPYPSVADAFFFVHTPLVMIGLWMFLKIHSMRVTRALLVRAGIFTLVAIGIAAAFLTTLALGRNVALWQLATGGAAPVGEVVAEATSVLYLVADAAYVALAALIARASAGKMSAGLVVLALGIGTLAAADVAYTIAMEGVVRDGSLADPLYLAGGLLHAVGLTLIIRPFLARFREPEPITNG